MENDIISLSGSLLIAAPTLEQDETFRRTAIYLAHHDAHSATGLTLNRPSNLFLTQFFPEARQSLPIYWGGPVELDTLFFLHRAPDRVSGGMPLQGDLFWGGDFSAVKRELACGSLQGDDIRFYIGYTGWGAGQLEGELREKSWLISLKDIDPLNEPHEGLWERSLCGLSIPYPVVCPSDPDTPAN